MDTIKDRSLEDFYEEIASFTGRDMMAYCPKGIQKEIGHFNVFDIVETLRKVQSQNAMPYDRRAYYKISLIRGKNKAEYADKVIQVENNALLFATPKIPYHWVPQDENQAGSFCIFTDAFLEKNKSSVAPDKLPIFQPGGYPVFEITDEQAAEIAVIFRKMKKEIAADYEYKYDLLRNYVLELIHHGQKLQPASALHSKHNAAERITSLFVELLERQFPIDSPNQRLGLKSAREYADRLAIHVNHLNKVLKENTGRTTTDIISSRIVKEAKILLRQTEWTISEIAFCLGFEEVAHFSNFFKKRAEMTPSEFRL